MIVDVDEAGRHDEAGAVDHHDAALRLHIAGRDNAIALDAHVRAPERAAAAVGEIGADDRPPAASVLRHGARRRREPDHEKHEIHEKHENNQPHPELLNDRLHHRVLEVARQHGHRLLNHQEADELLLAIDPEVRAERAVPPEAAVRLAPAGPTLSSTTSTVSPKPIP